MVATFVRALSPLTPAGLLSALAEALRAALLALPSLQARAQALDVAAASGSLAAGSTGAQANEAFTLFARGVRREVGATDAALCHELRRRSSHLSNCHCLPRGSIEQPPSAR